MEEIPQLTRTVFLAAVHAAFSDPSCVGLGGLHVEVHIGRKQASELCEYPDKVKWPIRVEGQPVYMINEDSYLKVVPAGTFKGNNS